MAQTPDRASHAGLARELWSSPAATTETPLDVRIERALTTYGAAPSPALERSGGDGAAAATRSGTKESAQHAAITVPSVPAVAPARSGLRTSAPAAGVAPAAAARATGARARPSSATGARSGAVARATDSKKSST
jgi:hypothetical protein